MGSTVSLSPLAGQGVGPQCDDEPRFVPFAVVEFARLPGGLADPMASADALPWSELMLARKVIRAEYDERVELDTHAQDALKDVEARCDLVKTHVVRDSATLLFLGKSLELAETTMLNRDSFARELGQWLVDERGEESRGMRGREFGLRATVAERLRRGLRREIDLLPDEVAGFAHAARRGVTSASCVVVLTAERDDVSGWLEAGQVYEELALRLWHRGYCTAVHAGLAEVEGPSLALRGRLRTARRPVAVFRVGRPLHDEDWMRPHAARPKLEDVLLPESKDLSD